MSCNQKDKLKMELEIYKGLNYSVTEIKSKDDVVYIKLRRGIKVSFYNH